MTRRLVVVVALVMAVITASAIVPPRALATDSLVYIIPAAIGGAVTIAVVIAILVVDRKKEPELDLTAGLPPRDAIGAGLRFGSKCRTSDGTMPLLCW